MQYSKYHEFIIATGEDGKCVGKLNLLTGEYYGKSGKLVKSRPECFQQSHLRIPKPTYWGTTSARCGARQGFWAEVCWNYFEQATDNRFDEKARQGFEQLVSLGIMPDCHVTNLSVVPQYKLNKQFLDAYKAVYVARQRLYYQIDETNNSTVMAWYPIMAEQVYIEITHKEMVAKLDDEQQRDLYCKLVKANLPTDYCVTVIKRCAQENLLHVRDVPYECGLGNLTELLVDYYDKCIKMYGSCKVTPNFISHYYNVCAEYTLWKNANATKLLAQHNGVEKLLYKNDTFFVQLLTTPADFHNEATAQHNCVESMYMERVAEMNTHVVSIRRVSDPKRSYITCEVDNRGRICQFLGFSNKRIQEADALRFEREYQEWLLKQTW